MASRPTAGRPCRAERGDPFPAVPEHLPEIRRIDTIVLLPVVAQRNQRRIRQPGSGRHLAAESCRPDRRSDHGRPVQRAPGRATGLERETAVLTLPAGYPSGIYQLGFEAILPGNNSSYSNLLDNVTIPIKPLIDLGGSQMNAVAIEGLRRRRSRCGSMAASTRPSRWCSRPPARPSRTRTTAWANPPACRVPRPRWSTRTAAIPGLCWCRKASTTAACRQPWAAASSACPSKPWRMTPPKTTRPRSSRCRRQASTARLPH